MRGPDRLTFAPTGRLAARRTPSIDGILRLASAGDFDNALQAAESTISQWGEHPTLDALVGALHLRKADPHLGIPYLRRALHACPRDVTIADNLAVAFVQVGKAQDALAVCAPETAAGDPTGRLWKRRAFILQGEGQSAAAADAYRQALDCIPEDSETWNNLGNALADGGDHDAAIGALRTAVRLCPDAAPIRLNLATALVGARRLEEAYIVLEECNQAFSNDTKPLMQLGALARQLGRSGDATSAFAKAAAIAPDDRDVLVQLGIQHFDNLDLIGAEEAFKRALEVVPADGEVRVLLGLVYEHSGRGHMIGGLTSHPSADGLDSGSFAFLNALECKHLRQFAEGLELLGKVPAEVEPVRTAQLEGQFHDALNDPWKAVRAFNRMNEHASSSVSDCKALATEYWNLVERDRAIANAEWLDAWPTVAEAVPTSPVFLVGFPRSGTTLLDTLLMGHPRVRVLEEQPLLLNIEREVGGIERLTDLREDEVRELRNRYFKSVRALTDLPAESILIDKSPLHMNRVPLIHRLFPDARFILALRHPMDVVLSCFMTNFNINTATANFTNLRSAADLYDASFSYWSDMRDILPLRVHDVRYERVVVDVEAELRLLVTYLGLEWNPGVMDHRKTADQRGVITTASYSQVREPLYGRASGRWSRYRQFMTPVAEQLAPWIERLGYDGEVDGRHSEDER